MNKIIRLVSLTWLIAAVFGFGTSAPAAESGANDPFKSYQSMMEHIRNQGIEPSTINWDPITSMCLDLKGRPGTDERPFNKCLYEKANDKLFHETDRAQCLIRVKASYPDSLKNGRTDTLRETDKDGQVHTYERTSAPVSATELEQLRSGALVECMQNLGWANADDWRPGKRKACQ